MNNLGVFYEKGLACEKDMVKAINYYKTAADKGIGIALSNLGLCYRYGRGVPKNLREALNLFKKAVIMQFLSRQKHSLLTEKTFLS